MTASMTGFASREGSHGAMRWTWELRSVNGRGLDLRLRLPDSPDGIEAPARAALQKHLGRGNVTLSLKLTREGGAGLRGTEPAAIRAAIQQLAVAASLAAEQGMDLAPASAADVLTMARAQDAASEAGTGETEALRAAILGDLTPLIKAFTDMRNAEGAALAKIIAAQVDAIEAEVTSARALGEARATHARRALEDALDRVMGSADSVDPDRVAQELALIAVKTDVAEELDRLEAHVAAARALLEGEGPKGRKLDFLTQEFNREANTLASKAQYPALTRIGLDLKHVIDQMREQVQNVE